MWKAIALALALLAAGAPGQETETPETPETRLANVEKVLDDLHAAAAAADGERYFDLFAPGAVFLGTDATERWTIEEFKEYALPRFEQGTGWTYHVRERHVDFARGRGVAWFDERLWNERYGATRGSGVLVRESGAWRIAQYVLSFAVPNDKAREVVALIDAKDEAGDGR